MHPGIVEQLQQLLHVRVPEAPPPHMMRVLEGICVWLLERMRLARAQKDKSAHTAYVIALLLAPK